MVTLDSLQKIARTEIKSAGPRYTPSIDNKSPNLPIKPLLRDIDCLVRSKVLFQSLNKFLEKLKDFISRTNELDNLFRNTKHTLQRAEKYISELVSLGLKANFYKLNGLRKTTENIFSVLENRRSEYYWKQKENAETESAHLQELQRDIPRVNDAIKMFQNLTDWTDLKSFQLINSPLLFLCGEAGSGKTHFLCDLAKKRLEEGYPTLLVLGQKFTKITDPFKNIAEKTKCAKNKAKLLSDLEKLAIKSGERALIIIDAINEGDYMGWEQTLQTLVEDIKAYPAVAIIISARTPYEKTILGENNGTPFLLKYHYGFADIEFDALIEFFKYYKIPTPEVPLLYKEFSNPLFLKLFCETFKRVKDRKKRLKEIYSGQKTMTTFFEDYIKHQGKLVEKKFNFCHGACWNIVKGSKTNSTSEKIGVATLMAENSRDWILPEELKQILSKHTNLKDTTIDKLADSLVEYGILAKDIKLDEESKRNRDVIRFPYQKMSDHLIARSLLDKCLKTVNSEQNLECALHQDKPLGKIFIFQKWHQYINPGLAEAVTMEFPERFKKSNYISTEKKEIYEFLPVESRHDGVFFRDIFLPGLYWRSKDNFSDCTHRYISALLNCKDKAQEKPDRFGYLDNLLRKTLEVLTTLATREDHPYNAKWLYCYLKKLSLVKRDLLWTEYLRNADSSSSVVYRLLRYLDGHATPSSIENLMYIFTLFLSSTEAKLRDKATHLLCIHGKKNPKKLFDLCIESLDFNDPYIPERLLAASYGVAVRSLANTSIDKQCVKDFARELYNQMFAENAPNSTTHILSRDYAARIIQFAEYIQIGSFNASEIDRTKMPFASMGIKKWGKSKDKDEGKYRDGNAPIGDYHTLKNLVKNWDSLDLAWEDKKLQEQEIEEQILWRIYNLGYKFSDFAQIDKSIYSINHTYGNSDIKWAETYGQKYCWIAYYELAGWLLDRNKLTMKRNEFRISEIKIDPTFPNIEPTPNFLGKSCLDKNEINAIDWIKNGKTPNVISLLNKQCIGNAKGQWVLLDGRVSQENENYKKRRSFYIRGMLVKKENKNKVVRLLKKYPIIDNIYIPPAYHDHLIYAGEIPWCETFTEHEKTHLNIQVGTNKKQIKQNTIGFKKVGHWIEGKQGEELMDELLKAHQDEQINNAFLESFRKKGIEISNRETIHTIEEPRTERFSIFIPVRTYLWESHNLENKLFGNTYILEKQIIDEFKLVLNPDGMNFFDVSGNQVTYNVKFHASYNNNYDFIYIKKDFLDIFLTEMDMALLWVTWGERLTNFDHWKNITHYKFKSVHEY